MAKKIYEFSIDDALGTSENLAMFAHQLEEMDAALAPTLISEISRLAAGHTVDTAAIWNALYATTAGAVDSESAVSVDGTEPAA